MTAAANIIAKPRRAIEMAHLSGKGGKVRCCGRVDGYALLWVRSTFRQSQEGGRGIFLQM
jgi:hypothetical protein